MPHKRNQPSTSSMVYPETDSGSRSLTQVRMLLGLILGTLNPGKWVPRHKSWGISSFGGDVRAGRGRRKAEQRCEAILRPKCCEPTPRATTATQTTPQVGISRPPTVQTTKLTRVCKTINANSPNTKHCTCALLQRSHRKRIRGAPHPLRDAEPETRGSAGILTWTINPLSTGGITTS